MTPKTSEGKVRASRNKKGKINSKFIRFFTKTEFDDFGCGVDYRAYGFDTRAGFDKRRVEESADRIVSYGMVAMGADSFEKEAGLCERYGGPGVCVFLLGLTDDKN